VATLSTVCTSSRHNDRVCTPPRYSEAPAECCDERVLCLSVCISVCLSVCKHIPRTTDPNFTPNFRRTLLIVVVQSFFGGVLICYVLPVLWMTSCLHIVAVRRREKGIY